jgi:hypothetical protein
MMRNKNEKEILNIQKKRKQFDLLAFTVLLLKKGGESNNKKKK